MKKNLILLSLLLANIISAQRYNLLSGDFKNLKGISEYNIIFDYKELKVYDFDTEETYLAEKINKRKENEGKSETFKKDWYQDRENKYEPTFIESFNKRFEKGEIKCEKNKDLKYTMNIKTTWIYPGYSVVAGSDPAKISATVAVFETAHPDKILLVIAFDKSIGLKQGTFDFDQGYRIAGAYEKLAKNITMQLKRFL